MVEIVPAFLREQAARCRRLAREAAIDDRTRRILTELADEYEAGAAGAKRTTKGAHPVPTTPRGAAERER